MKTMVNIYEAKTRFSQLVDEVESKGATLVICRNKKPVADLVPHRSADDPLRPDSTLAGAVFHGDPCAPLPAADWPKNLQ